MSRPTALVLLIGCATLAGCQGLNPMTPYGSPRIDPPPTNGYIRPGEPYYQQGQGQQGQGATPPGSTVPTIPGPGPTSQNVLPMNSSLAGSSYQWQPAGTSAASLAARSSTLRTPTGGTSTGNIQVVGATSPVGAVGNGSATSRNAIRVAEVPATIASPRTPRDRMPVNDATSVSEPSRFQPPTQVKQISELPTTRRYLPPAPIGTPIGTGISAPLPVRPTTSTRVQPSLGGWQMKSAGDDPMGVASR